MPSVRLACVTNCSVCCSGKLDEAITGFRNQLKYSRTALDCLNTMTMIESIEAQLFVKERFGLMVTNIFNAAAVS